MSFWTIMYRVYITGVQMFMLEKFGVKTKSHFSTFQITLMFSNITKNYFQLINNHVISLAH